MTTSLLLKRISTIFIAAFVCFFVFAMPKEAGAKEYIFGSLFEHIAFKVGAAGEVSSEDVITEGNGNQYIKDSDFIWETARNTAGYDDSNWLGNETFSPKFSRSEESTYYGALENNVGMTDEQEKASAKQFYSDLGNALNEYAVASRFGSNSMLQVTDGTSLEENYRSYTVSDVAALKRESEAVLAVMAVLERDPDLKNVGYQENGITAPQLNSIREMKAAQEKATQILAFIAAGKIQPGQTIQAHEEGNLSDSGTQGQAIKVFDTQGNEIARAAATPISGASIYCWRGLPSPDLDPQGCIALGLYYGLLKPSSWVLWASGVAFNYSIDFTLNFGKFLQKEGLSGNGNSPGAIYLGWAAIRDLINVGFIFILLYAAIATILDLGGYGVKETIIKVVIAALLINFSLFFTKVFIDMSNLIALQFYSRVLSAANQAGGGSISNNDSWDSGISIGFVNALGLKSIWSGSNDGIRKSSTAGESEANSAFGSINPGQLIIICLGGAAFILVTAFTLFMATIRFLYRSIVLIFLMVLSPIGFVGSAIPALKGAASKWQSRLKSNLIFAPAYMAIFYVVSLIVFGKGIGPDQSAANSGDGLTGFGALFKGDVSSTGLLFWFIMIIGLMLGTQMAADQFADKLDIADSFKKKAKGWATGFGKSAAGGFGSAGYVGRRAVGNTGMALSQNKLVQSMLTRGPLKNIGGQALYNKIGDLKDKKVGGYSLTDAKKARETRDEKTRERLAEVKKPGLDESQGDYKLRKDIEEMEAKKAHLKRLGIQHDVVGFEYDAMTGKTLNAGKIVIGAPGSYSATDTAANKKAEAAEFDRAAFEATKLGGVVGASMAAAIKKERTGNKGSVKGIEDQIKDLEAKKIAAQSPAFITVRDTYQGVVDRHQAAYDGAVAGSPAQTAAAEQLLKATKKLNAHIKALTDADRQIAQLEKDIAIANSRTTS